MMEINEEGYPMSNKKNEPKKRIDFPYPPLTRRQFVTRGAAATAGLLLAACGQNGDPEETPTQVADIVTATDAPGQATEALPTAETAAADPTAEPVTLEPTPQCDDDDDETPAQTEGPFYTPDTPERTSFLEDGPGTKMVLTGRVLTTDCQPVFDAVIDFWHADDGGNYDNVGFLFRGHQFTDADGRFQLETIVPGLYPGRTRHFHVKVQGRDTSLLTTQLYFPGEPDNAGDGIFNEALLIETAETDDGLTGQFDFVL
jgi:protocatechuate 3,4-dioxygenase beta subunit